MKRIISFTLALASALALAAPAMAEEATIGQGNQNIEVYAKYEDGSTTDTVYSVDISWGNMQFTYAKSGTRTWVPSTHTYEDGTTSAWTADGNTITVTNHSNAEVTASFSFAPLSNLPDLQGSFSVPTQTLAAGAENNYAGADSLTTALTLSGAYTGAETFTQVGTVTVAIQ